MATTREAASKPREAAANSVARVLFIIVTSRATRSRAYDAFTSWCGAAIAAGSHCQFISDHPYAADGSAAPAGMKWTVQKTTSPSPSSCCRNGKGFFCSPHRRRTLAAQYRYLPALALARGLQPYVSGQADWVVLLDDDSFVFVRRLLRLLGRRYRRPQQHALMLGEFKPDASYACGGAGAVLSRAALELLDLEACISRTRRKCMQSDWQLGECVQRASARHRSVATATSATIQVEASHGCGSCADARATWNSTAARLRSGCQFMQDANAHADWLLQTANCSRVRSPSIVHGGKGVLSSTVAGAPSLAARLAKRQREEVASSRRSSRAQHGLSSLGHAACHAQP